MAVHLTRDGDMVDRSVWDHYGDLGQLDAVFAANPGLARRGARLPAGVEIHLPHRPVTAVQTPVRQWGPS